MEDFLEKIQLIQHKQIKLPIDKTTFVKAFRENVDEGEIGIFSGMFEAFSSSKNKYKGTITHNQFDIRKRKVFFRRNNLYAKVNGTFRQQADYLVVDLTINGFSKILFPFYAIAIVFYILFIFIISRISEPFGLFYLIIPIHAVLMFGIPYFIMRKNVKNTANDIEKELFFITRKDPYNL